MELKELDPKIFQPVVSEKYRLFKVPELRYGSCEGCKFDKNGCAPEGLNASCNEGVFISRTKKAVAEYVMRNIERRTSDE